AAVRTQQLHREETDETSPGDDKGLAQSRLSETNPLQSDSAHHRESRGLVAHAVGNAGAEVPRHGYDVGVRPIRDHTVTGTKSLCPVRDVAHDAHVAVAERDRLTKLGADRAECGEQAVCPNLVE